MDAPASRSRGPLGVLFLTVFIDLVGFGIVIPILPTYAKSYGASAFEVGLLGTIYSLMQLVFAPVWGRLSDRIGRRPVIIISAAGAAVAYGVFGMARALPLMFVARGFAGACGANISTAQAYIADVTTPENRARGMAIIGAGFGLGFTFGPIIGGLGAHFLGVRAPFFIAAGLAVLNVAWATFALPEPPRHERAARRRVGSYGDAFRIPALAFSMIAFFVYTYSFSNIEATFALFNNARLGYVEKQNGYVFTYIGLVLSFVQWFGTRRLVGRLGEQRLVMIGAACIALGAALVTPVHGLPLLIVATTFIAAGSALTSPMLSSMISRAAPADRQGEMLGVAQSVGALGRIAGPAAGGFLFDRGFGHTLPYVTAAVLTAAVSAAMALRRDAV